METQNKIQKTIVMFPWLGHGHIFPFLELAKRISKRKNFYIYLCSTAVNSECIKKFIDTNSLNEYVELLLLQLPSAPPELPPHYLTTKNLPSNLLTTLITAFQTSRFSFSDIIRNVNPDLVIYDAFQPWASDIASSHGIPAVHFAIGGAMPLCFVHHRFTFREAEFPFPAIRLDDHQLENLDAELEFMYTNIVDAERDFLFGNFKKSRDIVLIKTTRGVEGKYIDYLSALSDKKLVPVGPLVVINDNKSNQENREIIEWLNKKTRHSTVFISFGSEHFLSNLEIKEIANALELCPVNFIWIIRYPVGTTVTLEKELPQGFLDRVGERGVVVTGWVPQAEILAHPNTGGFVSHCGWSSSTESMYYGVPVIAMPMMNDQPLNARMLAEAGICVEVERKRKEGYKGEEIAKAMEKVFSKGRGDELRGGAGEVSERMRGEEEQVLDEAAKEVWQICINYGISCKNAGN